MNTRNILIWVTVLTLLTFFAASPALGQANSFPVPGGLSLKQVTQAIAAIGAHLRLGAAAVTSFAPEYDSGTVCRAAFAAIGAILAGVRAPS